jgi:hypothetical protein
MKTCHHATSSESLVFPSAIKKGKHLKIKNVIFSLVFYGCEYCSGIASE